MSAVVVIIGAGPAGARAALALAAAGIRPIVIDEQPRSGGQIYRRPAEELRRSHSEVYGDDHQKAFALHSEFDAAVAAGHIDWRPSTTAWAVHENYLHIECAGRPDQIDFDRLLIASGAVERVIPLPNWTLPGTFSLGGAQIALKAHGCAIGERVAFVGTGPLLYLVALQYAQAGADVVGVFDTSPFSRRISSLPAMLARPDMLWRGIRITTALAMRYRVKLRSGVRPVAIRGSDWVEGVAYEDADGRAHEVACTAIGLGYDLRPEVQLADLAGCEIVYDPRSRNWRPQLDAYGRTSVADVYVAGDGAGIAGADAAELAGSLAAHAILVDLGQKTSTPTTMLETHESFRRFRQGVDRAFAAPIDHLREVPADTVLCRCEGVTVKAFKETVAAMGAREINRAKSMTRCGMGRCQGRYCEFAASELLAQMLDVPRQEVGRLRAQPPVKPFASSAGQETRRGDS